MTTNVDHALDALRSWGYQPGPNATDYADLFPKDFAWGADDGDDAIFEDHWNTIGARNGVVWLRFQSRHKPVSDEVLDDWACIMWRSRCTGEPSVVTGLGSTVNFFDSLEHEGLFALTDDEWMLLAMSHNAVRVAPLASMANR